MPASFVRQYELNLEELRHYRAQQAAYPMRFYATDLNFSRVYVPRRAAQEEGTSEERQAAEARARGLLEEHVGAPAMAKILNGGGYVVRSRWWPDVIYMIPRNPHERVRVLQAGAMVPDSLTESCLVTTDVSLPWPDVMLQRIRAIELDESVVWNTGVLHPQQLPRGLNVLQRTRRWFGR